MEEVVVKSQYMLGMKWSTVRVIFGYEADIKSCVPIKISRNRPTNRVTHCYLRVRRFIRILSVNVVYKAGTMV